nr:hypothetical protein [Tanacetum cinerariifolium]
MFNESRPFCNLIEISSLVFHPYLPLQIPDIKSIKVDPMLYDIKVVARCISIWKATIIIFVVETLYFKITSSLVEDANVEDANVEDYQDDES